MAGPRRVRTGTLYDTGEVVQADGVDIWVVRAGPRGGVPVVFLHGIPTSGFLWRNIVRAMDEEHDCIAFDWPGFGQSAKPREHAYDHAGRVRDLAALLDAMGIEKAHLVAHDIGGPAAMLFALEHPQRVGKVALLNTTLSKREYRPPLPALIQLVPLMRGLVKPLATRAAFDVFFRRGLAHPERVRRELLDAHWRLATRDRGKDSILAAWMEFHDDAAAIEVVQSGIKSYRGDVLVLFGAEDAFLPPLNAERLARSFPRARLQLLPGAGHYLQEDAPDEVGDRLLTFLAE